MFRALAFTLVASTCALQAGCSEPPATDLTRAASPVPVIVEPLKFDFAETRIEAVGTSRATRSIDVYPLTAGEVVAVNFEPGERVEAGQVLVELDRRQQQLDVRVARLQLEEAERLYDRYKRSAGSGAVLPTVLDAARIAAETARLEVERAQIALDDRTINAAFTGHVGTTEVERGDRINPETLITTLDAREQLLVTFEVPEAFIGDLGVGKVVELATWNSRAAEITGKIVDIGSRIDPQSRAFTARAQVSNENDELRPGMSFRVGADVKGELYPIVAETGLQWGADGAFVWSVANDQAERIPAKVVQRREGRVLIEADLDPGDVVVVEGIQRMRNGIDVAYTPTRLAKAPANAVAIQKLGADAAAGSD